MPKRLSAVSLARAGVPSCREGDGPHYACVQSAEWVRLSGGSYHLACRLCAQCGGNALERGLLPLCAMSVRDCALLTLIFLVLVAAQLVYPSPMVNHQQTGCPNLFLAGTVPSLRVSRRLSRECGNESRGSLKRKPPVGWFIKLIPSFPSFPASISRA